MKPASWSPPLPSPSNPHPGKRPGRKSGAQLPPQDGGIPWARCGGATTCDESLAVCDDCGLIAPA